LTPNNIEKRCGTKPFEGNIVFKGVLSTVEKEEKIIDACSGTKK